MKKNVLITGASRGIGFYTARLLLNKGCKVWALSRDAEGLERLRQDAQQLPGELIGWNMSFAATDDVKKRLQAEGVALDVLINNAAQFQQMNLEHYDDGRAKELFETNFFAALRLIKAAQPHFRRGAHVVNISSVGGLGGSAKFAELLIYSSSKGALNIATECLAEDWRDEGYYCNALALGSSSTEMFRAAFPGAEASSTPLQMAEYIVHFALNAPPLINGQVISLRNGWR